MINFEVTFKIILLYKNMNMSYKELSLLALQSFALFIDFPINAYNTIYSYDYSLVLAIESFTN